MISEVGEAISHFSNEKHLDRIEKYNNKIQEISNKYNQKIQELSIQTAKNWANLEVIESYSKNLLNFERLKSEVEGRIEEHKRELFIIEKKINPILDEIFSLKKKLEKEVHYYEKINEEIKKEVEKLSQLKNIISEGIETESVYIRYNVIAQKINNSLQEVEELEEKILDIEKRILILKENSSEEIKRHYVLQGELKEMLAKKEIMERTGKIAMHAMSIKDTLEKNAHNNNLLEEH